jgi:alpha-N-acetylglucosaminidase
MKRRIAMNKNKLFLSVVFVLLLLCSSFSMMKANAPNDGNNAIIESARSVLSRVLGERASEFNLEALVSDNNLDTYEIETKDGKVTVRGNSAIALTRGVYYYLRNAAHSQITWSGEHLNLPKPLPDYPVTQIATPYKFRLYYNVCAFGYTTAFWDWKRWERELDWMALHGINMPLAMSGQEAVWQKVWNSFGISNEELKDFFSGPAFLPWHRMGNLNKHDGPLPQQWLDKSKDLQKKILNRMRELGMTPVVPAFAGFVPPSFKKHNPSATVLDMAPWAGFDADNGTHILSPKSPLFVEIGKKFIEEYRNEYGECHYYLSDSFNEMEVPVTKDGRYDELADFGEAVFRSIAAGDPQGTWVMQGWLFYNDASFWDTLSVQALLKRVPNDKMIIIDLANELWHGWKVQHSFYGKQWIYSVIHNAGGDNPMYGPLKFFSEDGALALNDSAEGNLIGYGISPEGIENNEVVYELLTDAEWSDKPLQLDAWLKGYCISRYGGYPPAMEEAWKLLVNSVYDKEKFNVRFGFQRRPDLMPGGEAASGPDVDKAVQLFLSCADELGKSELFRIDLIEMAGQYCGNAIDRYLGYAASLHEKKDKESRDWAVRIALDLMKDMDKIIASRNDRRLERWIDFARAWGESDAEKNYYERDAKRQVTVWGGPYLSEYAAKLWSGLVRDYYANRWKLFYEHIDDVKPFDLQQWEEQWITAPGNLSLEDRFTDPFAGYKQIIAKIDLLDSLYSFPISISSTFDSTRKELAISLNSTKNDVIIRYTSDGTEPVNTSAVYAEAIGAGQSTIIKARGFRNGNPYGKSTEMIFHPHKAFGKSVQLRNPYSPKYTGGGTYGLTDCQFGSTNFHDGRWQGFQGDDVEAVIDLGKEMEVKMVSINCLQNTGAWIFFPASVEFSISEDGVEFSAPVNIVNDVPNDKEGKIIKSFSASVGEGEARYIKVKAKSIGTCPPGHAGAGQKAWTFVDEITVN